jgi:hypothetical protein
LQAQPLVSELYTFRKHSTMAPQDENNRNNHPELSNADKGTQFPVHEVCSRCLLKIAALKMAGKRKFNQ